MRKLFFVLLLTLQAACQNCGNMPTPRPTDAGVDAAESDAADMAPVVCEPGEIVACREENTPAIDICNEAGTGTDPGSCPTTPTQVCREGACVEVACIPNSKRCVDDRTAQACESDGSAWLAEQTCPGGSTCQAGNCLDRCQLAELTNSYIGCEY